MADLSLGFSDEGVSSRTSTEQLGAEEACQTAYEEWMTAKGAIDRNNVVFYRAEHAAYLMAGLGDLASGYVSLDASRPWLCYWIVHSLELLGERHALAGDAAEDVVRFLGLCQAPGGGFAGGPVPGQSAHLAPTYAAINTLVTIGTRSALQCVDRPALHAFLKRMKREDGSFTMHDDGECDVRASAAADALAAASRVMRHVRGAARASSCQPYTCLSPRPRRFRTCLRPTWLSRAACRARAA